MISSLIFLCHACNTGTFARLFIPTCLAIPSWSLKHHNFISRTEFSFLQDFQVPLTVPTNTITFHPLLKPQGMHGEICLLLHFDNNSKPSSLSGLFLLSTLTTIPELMNSGPDSNVKLQEKKKIKSLKMPSLSHMHYESLNAMQHCPNGFDNDMLF